MNSDSDTDHEPTDSDADDARTLTVRVGSAEQTRSEALDRVRTAERGDAVDERHVLNFEDEADLARLVSETNLELLRAIAEEEPRSMRQVEETVERDHKEVHRNLTELEALGVVEFVEEGRAKRPVVRFDELEITVPIRRDGPDASTRLGDEESESVSEGQHSEV
jgi:predicted transcriptional regulator